MNILIANERLLFRFGVDRVLILLGIALKNAGHNIVVLANKYDCDETKKFSDKVVTIPVDGNDYLHQNEYTSAWLKNNYFKVLPDFLPDIVLVGGWPFFTSIPFFNNLGAKTVFMDCGAVPLEGFDEGQILIQTKLRELRKTHLLEISTIIAISDFIANSQSLPDSMGQTPIISVLLAADHMKPTIENKLKKYALIENINKIKKNNFKLIFSLGRWEPDNYKNSLAAFNILELIRYSHPETKLMVLGHKEELNVANAMKDFVIPVGHPDDNQLLQLMELSDVGIIVSKWEGFNLPLAEMQAIEKPAFVFNLAAHPEVVVHPWFLCETNEDMAKKISLIFSRQTEELQSVKYEQSHDFFKWDRVVGDYKEIFEHLMNDPDSIEKFQEMLPYGKLQVVIDVSSSCLDPANSGVIRVTRRLSAEIQKRINPIFVLWDKTLKEYVFPTQTEYQQLGSFNGPSQDCLLPVSQNTDRIVLKEFLKEHPCAFRWLILAELFSENDGRHIRNYAKTNNLRIASIFYDAIPVLYPEYCNAEVIENHTKYMEGLSECNVVIPISKYSADCLKEFWDKRSIIGTTIFTDELPGEFGGSKRVLSVKERHKKINILCVSTLEPRKNHKTLLKAIELLEEQYPDLDFKLTLIGNRYAGAFEIAENIEAISSSNPNIEWLGPVSDDDLIKSYNDADFTIYPSIVEGFGMPVLESIWYAKPCICSTEGTMGDLAKEGGCLVTDVLEPKKLSAAIYQLATDDKLFIRLSSEAIHRKIKIWKEYTDMFLGVLLSKAQISHTYLYDKDSAINNKKILICSNTYPPNFIGGAELVAHYQAKELINQGYEVKVFSGDVHSNRKHYHLKKDIYDGVQVYRIKLEHKDFSHDYVNFSHLEVQNKFKTILDDFNPSIVHMHNIIGLSVSLASIAKNKNIKTLLTLHDAWGFCYKNTMMINNDNVCNNFTNCSNCLSQLHDGTNRAIPLAMRQDYFSMAFDSVDTFISPSHYLRNQYIKSGFDENKIIVLSNGIDIKHFSKISKQDDNAIRFTFIGYLGEHKGVQLILNALKLIGDKNNIKINIVGDGHLRNSLESYVKEEKLNKYVKFWGKIENKDIDTVFAQTDAYILPSMWPENQPVSITEAFASKVPVIGTELGGIKELVKNNRTGFLFPLGNVDELARKMQYFIDYPEKCIEFGHNAYESIKENSFTNQVSKLLTIYSTLPAKKYQNRNFIISCVGKQVSTVAHQVIQMVKDEGFPIKFVMHEWLDGLDKFQSDLVWVIDHNVEFEEVSDFSFLQKPFLIPEKNEKFKKFCIKENIGLYYDDADTAIECIYYLFKNNAISYALGENQIKKASN